MISAPTASNFQPVPVDAGGRWISWAIAFAASVIVVLGFALYSSQFLHWFVLPVLACAVLTGRDAVDWALGRVSTFDVKGIFGIFGYFFFFLAPLLHVAWNFWMWEVVPPSDWRPWLGCVAALNALGLVCLKTIFSLITGQQRRVPASNVAWIFDFRVFPVIMVGTLILTAILQSWVYVSVGGVGSFVEIFHESYSGNEDRFAGSGWIFMISESFPIIAAFAAIAYMRKRKFVPQPWQFALGLLCFFGLQTYFGGLRGSRLNTAELLFWAVGAYHYYVKPVSRSSIAIGTVALVGFMYVYGFYKDGTSLSTAFASQEKREAAQRLSHRSFQGLILGDLGRADVQAFILFKTVTDPNSFRRAHGQTYLSAFALFVPRSLRPSSLVNKEEISSDLIWGPGVYTPGVLWSTRIYGLTGEAILNFGMLAVPFAFAALGFIIAHLQLWVRSLHDEDARLLVVPFLTYLCSVWAVSSDLDNVVFSILKQGFVVGLVLIGSTKRVRIRRLFLKQHSNVPCKAFIPA